LAVERVHVGIAEVAAAALVLAIAAAVTGGGILVE
jgi:hypothetical protein